MVRETCEWTARQKDIQSQYSAPYGGTASKHITLSTYSILCWLHHVIDAVAQIARYTSTTTLYVLSF